MNEYSQISSKNMICTELLQKSKQILSLIERMKKQEKIFEFYISTFDKTHEKLESKRAKLEKEELEIISKFLSEIENEDFFKNPSDEVKNKVDISKFSKKKLEFKKKQLLKEEENLKNLNRKLNNKVKALPANKKDLYLALQNQIVVKNENNKDKDILQQNPSLTTFIKKICDKYDSKINSDDFYEEVKNTENQALILKLFNEDKKNEFPSSNNNLISIRERRLKNNALKNSNIYERPETEGKIMSMYGKSKEFEKLGLINKTFFIRRKKILNDYLVKGNKKNHKRSAKYCLSEENEKNDGKTLKFSKSLSCKLFSEKISNFYDDQYI